MRGSSPLTRGALLAASVSACPLGIIPAYAGSTRSARRSFRSNRDHPRLRGEHLEPLAVAYSQAGSSPLTRGAPAVELQVQLPRGIIPAYAGSTCSYPTRCMSLQDHPRLRGEHPNSRSLSRSRLGSSPLTRGAPQRIDSEDYISGIIPAYAGSTPASWSRAAGAPDHPRLRGEHRNGHGRGCWYAGSSPLTRGAPSLPSTKRTTTRIIPAYAGSTTVQLALPPPSWDHPRLRGEHPCRTAECIVGQGSSPLTRGAHHDQNFPERFGTGSSPLTRGASP